MPPRDQCEPGRDRYTASHPSSEFAAANHRLRCADRVHRPSPRSARDWCRIGNARDEAGSLDALRRACDLVVSSDDASLDGMLDALGSG
jgi:hypothetical protein